MEMETDMADGPVNIQSSCRLCLSERSDSLKSIFDPALSPNCLPQKIQQLVQIQVNRNDKLSTMVCNDCIIRLDTWFSYKKQCHRNQAKLAEWLNKAVGHDLRNMNVHIKSEPPDVVSFRFGQMPIKTEYPVYNDVSDVEFSDFRPSFNHYLQESNDAVYLEDLQNAEETEENSVKCPECGKIFGNAQNRRRHQNTAHRKDKRAQMVEIKKPEPPKNDPAQSEQTAELATTNSSEASKSADGSISTETNSISNVTVSQDINNSGTSSTVPDNNITSSETDPTTEASKEDSNKSQNETSTEKMDECDKNVDDETNKEKSSEVDENSKEKSTEIAKESSEKLTENSEGNPEKSTENSAENPENIPETTEMSKQNSSDENADKPNEELVESVENDQQKIEFAAGLKLVQKDTALIECEGLSKIELSYIEKCKAMVSMFHTLQCACHDNQHKTLRHLLSHLREMRVWFPLFTCYSCMISFTDRSTFTKHHAKCPRSQLETLIKLSNLRKRSDIKPRLYQNYKCNRCKFLFSFHEDFCKHINEDHSVGVAPFFCSCRVIFESLEEYKTHCYTSCVVSYYCDICFITTNTVDAFVKHCQETHDSSEGFILRQDDSYTPRNYTFRHKEADDEANVIEGKRERNKSLRELMIAERDMPPDPKDIPTKVLRKIVLPDEHIINSYEWHRKPSKCPVCLKEYSSVNNMIRHYRTHIERKEIELPNYSTKDEEEEDLYSCPECGGVYGAEEWTKHLEENHPTLSCGECDKEFQFQTELDQHRSVHLNLKVYRDSKTDSYKTAAISPGAETNGIPGEVMMMCEVCDTMFKSKEELKQHKLMEHDAYMSSSSSMENLDESMDDSQSLLQPTMELDHEMDFKESNDVKTPVSEKIPCEHCGRIYSSVKTLKEHMLNKHGQEYIAMSEYPKKCPYCDKVCSNGAGFAIHVQTHERDKKGEFPKKCEYCDKMCTSGAGLYLHTQMHERMTLDTLKREKPTPVKIEPSRDRKRSMNDNQEEESYHTCKRCFKVFGTKYKLKDHMRVHGIIPKKSRKILCDLCHVAVSSSAELEKHKAEEHADDTNEMPVLENELEAEDDKTSLVYTCDVCVETFDTQLEFKKHKESHAKPIVPKTKTSQIYCKYCKIAFDTVNDLTKHMHVEHGESAKPKVTKEKPNISDSPFKCPICNKAFISHAALTAHYGWHKRSGSAIEVPLNTIEGNAAMKLAKKAKILKKLATAAVTKHEPAHIPEFQCSTCFMELPNDTALQIHILEKHRSLDELMLIPRCHTCNQDFVTQEEYETHKRFHDFLVRQKKHEQQLQTPQFQTPVIQSVQSVSESPQQTTPKKFHCNWCNSAFSRNDTLNTHIKNHHKEHVRTEFKCTQCDRVFDKQSSLTIHLKVHEKKNAITISGPPAGSSGKIFSCSICSQTFKFPKDLRMHTISAHPF